jgi:hypothetical protein
MGAPLLPICGDAAGAEAAPGAEADPAATTRNLGRKGGRGVATARALAVACAALETPFDGALVGRVAGPSGTDSVAADGAGIEVDSGTLLRDG